MRHSNISFILYFVLISSILVTKTHYVNGKGSVSTAEEDDMEKVLSKKPVKTITAKIGDIIDCVDIYKQPAFDHPLLKDHKIQMNPSSIPGDTTSKTILSSSIFRGLQREGCPSGTIPIRRTTKENLVNAKDFLTKTKLNHTNTMHYHSVSAEEFIEGKTYFGGIASMTIHNLTLDHDQFTTSQIWILNGPPEEINCIEFGIAKSPSIFGDSRSRLFGSWTADAYKKTGCLNMNCPGFVQVNPNVAFGQVFDRSSIYGEIVYGLDLMVYWAPISGNWWLGIGGNADKIEPIGYWPNKLFTHLANNASAVRYGGAAGAPSQRPTPPMGNGYLPRFDDYLKTAFMTNMMYVNETGDSVNLNLYSIKTKQDAKPDCYNIMFAGKLGGGWDITMVYGGPGGMCSSAMPLG
ncbi:hypothetical protein MKX01_009269 [Papaver californicum]|nr:hypothetical protein MKX01_009269 [Papaver californicum]